MALASQMTELRDSKIEIMILDLLFSDVHAHRVMDYRTHTHTCHIGAHCIKKWYHMPALCNCAFDTGVESIAGEESQDLGLPGELRVRTVVIYEGLKPRNTANRLCRARSR